MTTYFDTSAIVPLLVDEPSRARCERTWHAASEVVVSTLAYVEAYTAIAQAHRSLRLTDAAYAGAIAGLDELWQNVTTIAPEERILRYAATLGAQHSLRGYDAVQCATALAAASDDFVAISGDRALLRAWNALGITTVDANS